MFVRHLAAKCKTRVSEFLGRASFTRTTEFKLAIGSHWRQKPTVNIQLRSSKPTDSELYLFTVSRRKSLKIRNAYDM